MLCFSLHLVQVVFHSSIIRLWNFNNFFASFFPRVFSGTAVLNGVLRLVKWANVDKHTMPIHGSVFFMRFGMCSALPTKSTLIPSGSFRGNRKKTAFPPHAEEWVMSKHTSAVSLHSLVWIFSVKRSHMNIWNIDYKKTNTVDQYKDVCWPKHFWHEVGYHADVECTSAMSKLPSWNIGTSLGPKLGNTIDRKNLETY